MIKKNLSDQFKEAVHIDGNPEILIENKIKYIDVKEIEQHPDNPRRDLGDLTELAESIKTSGILQNLTVVLGADQYRAVIGHRRLAAAKLAGLTEVPCIIADMDYKTQVATMLLENMQRSDLTVYEQAQGMQLMINLGETVADIASKTGFSEGTIKKRVKLLELDGAKFKAAQERGATLMDFARLNEVENIKDRDKLLDNLGTNNFEWSINRVLGDQRAKKNRPLVKEELKSFATKISEKDTNKYQYEKYIHLNDWKEGYAVPKDTGKKQYFFTIGDTSATLYTKRTKAEPVRKSEKEKEAEKCRTELKALTEQAYEMRLAFVKNFSGCKKNSGMVLEFLCKVVVLRAKRWKAFNLDLFVETIEVKDSFGITMDNINSAMRASSDRLPLLIAYCETGDDKGNGYVSYNYADTMPTYKENDMLDLIYAYLGMLGYKISDEEQALRDGTHELFEVSND